MSFSKKGYLKHWRLSVEPTIWCDMHGVPKNQQRGLVQPFIAAMQIFALVLMLSHSSLSSKLVVDFVVSLPALAAGTLLGIAMFRSVNELAFRRIILLILLFSDSVVFGLVAGLLSGAAFCLSRRVGTAIVSLDAPGMVTCMHSPRQAPASCLPSCGSI